MIPVLGEVIAGDWKSYQYLVESIRKFPCQVRQFCSVSYNDNIAALTDYSSQFQVPFLDLSFTYFFLKERDLIHDKWREFVYLITQLY